MSNARDPVVSNCEKKFLLKALSEWMRLDGRAFDEFRELSIQFGKDWGCCYVTLGKTRVLAQTSCEVQQPKSSRPSEGILNINLELNPIAAPNFEVGRQSELSVQLDRILEKCIKDSKAVDLESLCIKTNEKVWALRVDLNVINHEGNIVDCASIAMLASLAHFRRPDVTCDGEEFIIHSYKQRDPIPIVIHHYPLCISFAIFSSGEFIIADPNLLEEGVADAFLTVSLNGFRELCGLHLGGKVELTPDRILQTVNKAISRANNVIALIKESVEKDYETRQKEPVGFHLNSSETQNQHILPLEQCLDQWEAPKQKSKRWKKPTDTADPDEIDQQSDSVEEVATNEPQEKSNSRKIADVKVLASNTAAAVPKGENVDWQNVSSDDSGDEVVMVEMPLKPVESIEIADTDSEEDSVVILEGEKQEQ